MKNQDCAVLVLSCDAYSDLWAPFFTLFWRYWSDCPFDVFLGSNSKSFADRRVKTLSAGDLEWSDRLRRHLHGLGTSYVLICLEDFFLRRQVPTDRVLCRLNELASREGRLMRLVPIPGPSRPAPETGEFGIIDPGTPYRVSTQASIWRCDTLLDLLIDGESIWEFELNGTQRCRRFLDGFFAAYESVFPYDHHVVERGKWFPKDAKYFGRQGIGCDFSARAVMSRGEYLRWRWRHTISRMLSVLPWEQRTRLVAAVRSLLGGRSLRTREDS